MARDLVRVIQDSRKDIGCEYTDRIEVGIVTESTGVRKAIEKFRDYIAAETLANNVAFEPLKDTTPIESKLGDAALHVYVRRLP